MTERGRSSSAAMGTLHLLPAAALTIAAASGALAQTPVVRVAGRVQAQYSATGGDSSSSFDPSGTVSNSFEIRRLRLQAEVRIGDDIRLAVQPSFEMGALRMRDAYLRVGLWRSAGSSVSVTMGQEKKPFNRYELTSSNTLPSIERGARLRGLSGAAAQNNLLEENGYIAHDLGASAEGSFLDGRLVLKAGAYNGSGESAADVNNAKTFVARVAGTLLTDAEERPVLRLGGAFVSRDRAVATTPTSTTFAPDSAHRSSAWALELEWGDFRPGLHVMADFASGEALRSGNHCLDGATPVPCRVTGSPRNNGNLRPGTPDSAFATFRSFHVVAGWRIQLGDPGGDRLVGIVEPALRVDLTDPDTRRANDGGVLLTPVLNVHFSRTTVMRVGLDHYRYRDASGGSHRARAFRVSWQADF